MAFLQLVVLIQFALLFELCSGQTFPLRFPQCMDHEGDPLCIMQWEQRYWVRNDTYKERGPVFLWLGGEWNAEGDIERFQMSNYSETYGALQIALEHRFYGDSFPHRDYTTIGLRVLTSRQALADAARFIDVYKILHPSTANVPWVAFGCSYSGNLAAYFKSKYPNHVKTAVASSGPVKAVYDYPGHISTTFDVMETVDPECHSLLSQAFQCFNNVTNDNGSCDGFNSYEDIYNAMPLCQGEVTDSDVLFVWVVAEFWLTNSPTTSIRDYCPLFKSAVGENPSQKYVNFVNQHLQKPDCRAKKTLSRQLFSRLRKKEGEIRGIHQDDDDEWLMWTWQTCNEYGYFQSSGNIAGNLWGPDIWSRDCSLEWGLTELEVQRRINETNVHFGGTDLDVNCTQFVQGSWDPWHHLGIFREDQTNSENTVILMHEAQHCYDVRINQGPPVSDAQEQIERQIGTYMSSPFC